MWAQSCWHLPHFILRAKYENSFALTRAHYSGHFCIVLDTFGSNDESMQWLQQGPRYNIQLNKETHLCQSVVVSREHMSEVVCPSLQMVGTVAWRRRRRRCGTTGWSVWTTWPPFRSNWSSTRRRWAAAGKSWPWSQTTSSPCSERERCGPTGWDIIIIEEELVATLLHSVICLFMYLCLQTLLTLFSYLFQLLSDMGEYKEAMEVLKRALKLEPTTKVRLCGWTGPFSFLTILPVLPSHTGAKVKSTNQYKQIVVAKCVH